MKAKATGTFAVGRLLKSASTRYPDKEAIYCVSTGRRFSYSELNERTNRLASSLKGLGIKKGDKIAFLMTNRSEIVETYFAIAKMGLVGLPLNYRLNMKEIVQIMTYAGAQTLIYEDVFSNVADFVHQKLPDIKHYICIGKNKSKFADQYENLIDASSSQEPDIEIKEEDDFYMNLTSGTTGLPKAYMLKHYNNAAAIIDFTQMFNMMEDDVVLTVFPMFGRVGFAWSGTAIYNGAKHVVMNFDPKKVLEIIQTEKVSISNWVPAMANFVVSAPEVGRYDLSSLRGLVFAGSVFPLSLQEEVKKRICRNIYEYYGLQETGVIINSSLKDKAKNKESIGRVSPWAEVRIVDVSGKDVPFGTVGEVIARALTCITEYFNDEEKTKESFKNGWCYTGDLGRFDDQGYFYISGRIKDMIVTGGQNVFSAEVENCLMAHPDVEDCAVIGLPDKKWGEAIVAVIVRKPGSKSTESDVIEYCRNEIAGFKVPKKIIWYDDQLPRTPTGKVQKFVLVEKYSTR